MRNRLARFGAVAAIVAGVAMPAPQAAPKNWKPDGAFTGSSLTDWKPIGSAAWRAADGVITGGPGAGPGWFVLDRQYQDVAFYATVECTGACQPGVLVRAEATADGGLKGIFVSLAPDDLASYRLTVDAQGREVARERLRPAIGASTRQAPPPPAAPPAGRAGASGRGTPGPGAGRGGRSGPPPLPGGVEPPIARPPSGVQPGVANSIEIIVDANILRAFLNDAGGVSGGVADEDFVDFGRLALFAGGSGEVRYADVSWKDLQPRSTSPEHVSPHFRMQAINEFYYSWGPSIADINQDGTSDIVAGPYYYLGPDYDVAREIYLASTVDPGTQYFNGVQFAYDVTGDGWPDVINSLFTHPTILYVNPRGESRRWESYEVTERITSELALLQDVDGDGRLDYIFKDAANRFVYADPDPTQPTAAWTLHPISTPGPWANHGMGLGDVNGDGRLDFLNAYGWWAAPATAASEPWTYHPQAFGVWNRSSPGGAEMGVYDVNGDGLNDVVTSLQAHGWGLSWFEQKRGAAGAVTFTEHPVMGDFSTTNAGGVTFSELHGSAIADVDGDGTADFVTGKRYWSHLDSYLDPDPYGEPVLYVYTTVRDAAAPGGGRLVPELIHNRSGIGSNAAIGDLDGDGALDIVVSTRRGTFIFWNRWKDAPSSNGGR